MKQNNAPILAALCGILLAVSAHADVVGVDVNGTTTSAGVLDPSTRVWKAAGTSFALGSMTVNTSVSGAAGFGASGNPGGLPIFDNYQYNDDVEPFTVITVTISGLDDSQTYDLAVMMAQTYLGGRGGMATVTTAGANNPPAESTDPTTFTTFTEGDNYVLFQGLTTGTTPGQITFTVSDGPDGTGILNGFEIRKIDPNPGIRVPEAVSGMSHGEPTRLTVEIRNTADTDYEVSGASFSGPNQDEFSETDTPLTVPAGQSAELFVDFTPTAGGTASATLTLVTDDPAVPSVDVPLTVEVHDPGVSLAASSIDFGFFSGPPGPTPATVAVDNLGETENLTLSNPQITGAGASAFEVTDLSASVDPKNSGEIEVTFDPAGPGFYQAQLTIDTNDTYKPTVTINLSGTVQGGGTPVLQYGFDATTGAVTVPVNDDSGTGNHGANLLYNGSTPTYSADIPDASIRQFTTGVGSVDFTGTNVAISTAASAGVGSGQGILSSAQIVDAGGLTMEVWIKNPGTASAPDTGLALNMGGMYSLGVAANGNIGFFAWSSDPGREAWTTNSYTAGEWNHLAVVLSGPNAGATSYSNVTSYLNGNVIHSGAMSMIGFLTRATSVGNHQYSDWNNYEGLVYEPRVSLGVLTPAEFTVVAPPGGYTSWAAANAPGQAMNQDHDNDGVANGIEYFMGESGNAFTAMPVPDAIGAITWTKGAGYIGTYGADYRLETSGDLVTWDPVPQASVAFDADSIGYTLPLDDPRKFVRLVVTGP